MKSSIRPGLLLTLSIAFGAACAITAGAAGNLVANGDFEKDTALFTVWPGYTGSGANPANIPDWLGEGGRGINPVVPGGPNDAPFRDNGNNTSSIAFLQGASSISQQLSGFSLGETYELNIDFNSRNCCGDSPVATIYFNDTAVANSKDIFGNMGIPAVGGNNPWYHASVQFQAPAESLLFKIGTVTFAGGDGTLLIDNVSITQVPEPTTLALFLGSALLLGLGRRRR